jgi:hypothetical protein
MADDPNLAVLFSLTFAVIFAGVAVWQKGWFPVWLARLDHPVKRIAFMVACAGALSLISSAFVQPVGRAFFHYLAFREAPVLFWYGITGLVLGGVVAFTRIVDWVIVKPQ